MPNKLMMAYIRKKIVKGKTYYYIVEGVYNNKKKPLQPKQKVIRYLGNVESILEKFKFWDDHN